jgi:hypothetical protein
MSYREFTIPKHRVIEIKRAYRVLISEDDVLAVAAEIFLGRIRPTEDHERE